MHLFELEQNVSGTHEGEILSNRQAVIFRDRLTTELKYQRTIVIKTKITKDFLILTHNFSSLFADPVPMDS